MINYEPRKFKIQIREIVHGMNPRPEVFRLNDQIVTLTNCGWQGSDDKYPGEEMLWAKLGTESSNILDDAGISWIASGDLIELK